MIYWGLLKFFRIIFRIMFGLKVNGLENVPQKGRLIVASNHANFWDPVVVGIAMPRKIHFMAKEELFHYPVFRWIISKMAAFPVKRGVPDRSAIKYADSLLETEQILAMFPEGSRQHGEQLGSAQLGVAFFASRKNAPVLPIALIGTDRLKPFRSRMVVNIGRPLTIEPGDKTDKNRLLRFSEQVMRAIAQIRK